MPGPSRPSPRHGSDEYPRGDEPSDRRLTRVEERLRAEEKRGEERHGRVLAELSQIVRLVQEGSETCHEARDAAREGSEQLRELRRAQDDDRRRIDRLERDTDRYAPVAVRDFGSSPISVPQHPTPAPVDPAGDGGVQVRASLSSRHVVALVLAALGGGIGATKLLELLIGGGG